MKAYLPKTRPLSGDYPEKSFGESTGDGIPVLFEDSQYADWLGIFQRGIMGFSYTTVLGSSPFAFVIAHGQGYVVDIDRKEVVCVAENNYFQAAIAAPNKELAIAADFTNLFAYGQGGLLWESDRVSRDGICLDRVENTRVYGRLWFGDWEPFVLGVDDWQIEVGLRF